LDNIAVCFKKQGELQPTVKREREREREKERFETGRRKISYLVGLCGLAG